VKTLLRPTLTLLLLFTVFTGVLYPLAVTGVAQTFAPGRANGSLLERRGRVIGSELIGQPFVQPRYFWGRPSATARPYDAAASTGSNLGPSNPALRDAVAARVAALRAADPGEMGPVPADLVTTSGSGLDPHVSPAAAYFQLGRVAKARGLEPSVVRALVERQMEGRTFGILGEPRVNVLRLNLALDALTQGGGGATR
jgi:K+-transporting ATPase ATPase C chain